ncbi:MAG TPA: response regulator transcription factor [Candidatus Limnocylindria bacterium]
MSGRIGRPYSPALAGSHDDPQDPASRVLIVDDSAAVRAGIRALIDTDVTLRAVGEAANAVEGLSLARSLQPDLILLDNEMPGTRGLDLIPRLRAELPGTRVVMFSMSHAIADQALALGAAAVVSKDGGDAALLETLRQLRRGEDSTTVRLGSFARLRREWPVVATRDVGTLLAVIAGYGIGYLIAEQTLGAGAAVIAVAAVAVAGALLGPAFGVIAAIVISAITAGLWTITGHPVDATTLRTDGSGIGAIALLVIGAGSGALARPIIATRRADALLREAASASVDGGRRMLRLIRAALRSDAAMLFGLSDAGRQLRVAGTAGVAGRQAERTFLGVPSLAQAVRDGQIIATESADDLIGGARSAAFAPIIADDGTAIGVLATFYRRTIALGPRDLARLRAAAIIAKDALAD